MMKSLPIRSEASYTRGIWFVHHEQDSIVRVWLSLLNGKERIFVNEEVVSEKRNVTSMSTRHECMHGGSHYFIDVKNLSLGMGDFQCGIFRDGKLLGVYRTRSDQMGNISVEEVPDAGDAVARALDYFRDQGRKRLEIFDLPEAQEEFERALALDAENPEAHFALACIHSLEERTEQGIHHLRQALRFGLSGQDRLRTEPKLAFLRMQPGFQEGFS